MHLPLPAEVQVREVVVRVDPERMLPERRRVLPDRRLPPREHAEDDQRRGCQGEEARPAMKRRGGEHRPRETGEVGVAVGGDLRPGLHDAEHRRHDDRVAGRRGKRPGNATTERDERRAGHEHRKCAGHVPRPERVERRLDHVERREVERDDGLPHVEAEAVRRLRGAREEAVLRKALHVREVAEHQERGDHAGCRDHTVRRLLRERAARPSAERVHVEREQHERQRHAPRLREERQREAGERRDEPRRPPTAAVALVGHPEVGEDRQEIEEAGEHVAAGRRPRHRFDAQRMDRERERARDRGRVQRPRTHRRRREERPDEDVDEQGVRDVQRETGQMVAGGAHAPEGVVDGEAHPGERLVLPAEERGEHPAQVADRQAAEVGVVGEDHVVVPQDEAVLQGRRERGEDGDDEHQRGADETRPSVDRGTAHGFGARP